MERNVEKEDGKDEVLKEREEERMMRLRVGRGGGGRWTGVGVERGSRLLRSIDEETFLGGGIRGKLRCFFFFFLNYSLYAHTTSQ